MTLKVLGRLRDALGSLGSRIPGKDRTGLRLLFAIVALPILCSVVWFLILPWPILLRWRNPRDTSFMEYRIDEARHKEEGYAVRQEWIPLQDISPNLRRAVMAAEDDRFFQHGGIDWRSLAEEVHYQGDTAFSWWSGDDRRALWEALSYLRTHRSEIKGRSTITQQLAKNLYFSPKRSFVRKLNEAVVAKRLELFLPKDRILELYLNVAEWGPGIFGAEAAARAYFGTGAGDLTLGQAAALAATLPHPLTSNPSYRPAQMEWRRDLLLDRLRSPTPPRLPEVRIPVLPDTSTLPGDTISRIAG